MALNSNTTTPILFAIFCVVILIMYFVQIRVAVGKVLAINPAPSQETDIEPPPKSETSTSPPPMPVSFPRKSLTVSATPGGNVTNVNVSGTSYVLASNATLVQLVFVATVNALNTQSSFQFSVSDTSANSSNGTLLTASGLSGTAATQLSPIQVIPNLTNSAVQFTSNLTNEMHAIYVSYVVNS